VAAPPIIISRGTATVDAEVNVAAIPAIRTVLKVS